jgi:kynurenine formamidase
MLYDLTQTLNENTPVYPGDPKVKIEQVGVIAKDGFCDHLVTFGTHNGTHMDAPAHMIDGGKELKDYPVERFVVPAVCIDVRSGFDAAEVTKQIPETGLGVLFYTGASDYFHDERYWHDYSVPDGATVKALIDKKVSLVGVDTGSFDNTDSFPVHKALLGADILLIENLTNVGPLTGKRFELYALPIKLEQDGAPARVIAKME